MTGDRVAPDALGGAQIDESTLGRVPFAAEAARAPHGGRAPRWPTAWSTPSAPTAPTAPTRPTAPGGRRRGARRRADHAGVADARRARRRNEASYDGPGRGFYAIIVACDAGRCRRAAGHADARRTRDFPIAARGRRRPLGGLVELDTRRASRRPRHFTAPPMRSASRRTALSAAVAAALALARRAALPAGAAPGTTADGRSSTSTSTRRDATAYDVTVRAKGDDVRSPTTRRRWSTWTRAPRALRTATHARICGGAMRPPARRSSATPRPLDEQHRAVRPSSAAAAAATRSPAAPARDMLGGGDGRDEIFGSGGDDLARDRPAGRCASPADACARRGARRRRRRRPDPRRPRRRRVAGRRRRRHRCAATPATTGSPAVTVATTSRASRATTSSAAAAGTTCCSAATGRIGSRAATATTCWAPARAGRRRTGRRHARRRSSRPATTCSTAAPATTR